MASVVAGPPALCGTSLGLLSRACRTTPAIVEIALRYAFGQEVLGPDEATLVADPVPHRLDVDPSRDGYWEDESAE